MNIAQHIVSFNHNKVGFCSVLFLGYYGQKCFLDFSSVLTITIKVCFHIHLKLMVHSWKHKSFYIMNFVAIQLCWGGTWVERKWISWATWTFNLLSLLLNDFPSQETRNLINTLLRTSSHKIVSTRAFEINWKLSKYQTAVDIFWSFGFSNKLPFIRN